MAYKHTCLVKNGIFYSVCVHIWHLWLQIGRPLYTEDSISPIGGGAARQQSQSVLLVDEVRPVDEGTYTCTAQNLQGAKSVSATIKVVPKAKPKKP